MLLSFVTLIAATVFLVQRPVLERVILMASAIPHFSGKSIGRVPREQVIPVLFGVAVFVLLLATFPMEVLAGVVILFLALIPFSIRSHRRWVRRDADRAKGFAG